ELAGGDRPGDHPGPHRVPADLLERPPAHQRGADRLGRSRRRLHRGDAAGHRDRGAHLLPPRHRQHPQRLGALADQPVAAVAPRCADGLAGHPRVAADRDPRAALRGADRLGLPRPAPDGPDADRLRHPARHRRPRRRQAPHAGPADRPPRHRLRLRAGARAHPRRVALGRHHHRRAAARIPARGRDALRLPARGARGLRLRPLQAHRRDRRRRHLGPDGRRHHRRLPGRLRGHRLADALHQHAQLHALRGLPPGPRGAADRPGGHRRARPRRRPPGAL
ncbi:MAG: Undecaprenyl-diphosphatase, partial [uncultured Solirubrobacteraceae bacterium]